MVVFGPPFTRRVENQPQALRRAARDRGAAEQEAETARWNDAVSELRKVHYPLVKFCRKDEMWKAMFLFRLEEERDWGRGPRVWAEPSLQASILSRMRRPRRPLSP